MRNFPNSADLSDRQKAIYSADLNSAMMILGPPGTGKTVLAIHRGMRLLELAEESIGLFMYNNTLKNYTQHQTSEDRRLLNSVKTVQKHIGDRFKLINSYIRWGKNYPLKDFPYEAYAGRYNNFDDAAKKKFFPEYTILDEGQDYPETFYKLIAVHWANSRSKDFKFYPTIMADENQRLTIGKNTDIKSIESILGSVASIESLYTKKELKENYRNTLPIAMLGSRFYVGINEQAELPIKNGNKPEFFFFDNYSDLAERIVKYKINFPNQTIGILFSQDASSRHVKRLKNNLILEVDKRKSKITNNFIIQYYLSEEQQTLDFTSSNTITVLTYQSAKGLEFDTVFIPDIETLDTNDDFYDDAMKMYVLLHRPREMLFLGAMKSSSNKKDNESLPSFFTKRLQCVDEHGKEIEIGFNGIDDVKSLINIAMQDRDDQPLSQTKKIQVTKNVIIKKAQTSQANQEPLKSSERKVIDAKLDAIYNEIKDKEFKKLPKHTKKIINALETNEKLTLFKKVNEYSLKKRRSDLSENSVVKTTKSAKDKINKIKRPKNVKNKKVSKNESEPTMISYVSGSGNMLERKIVTTIKEEVIKKNIAKINIVSLSEASASIVQKLNSSLSQNRLGIAEYFMLNERDNKIIFADINKQKREICVSNQDDLDNYKESIIVLGLENIRSSELDSNIGDLLIHLMTNDREITEFIVPELDFEIPAITFIKDKMDDGSLKEKKYEY